MRFHDYLLGKENDPDGVSVVFDLLKSETRFIKLNPKTGLLTKRCYILVRKYSEATGNHVLNGGYLHEKMSLFNTHWHI